MDSYLNQDITPIERIRMAMITYFFSSFMEISY